jgi:glycosyltransferase involved in cell wall biosynthesis
MKSKIVVITRTLNESRNIARFCQSFQQLADVILVADGNSTDDTVKIAKYFQKTKVRHYDTVVELENGYKRNPDWLHINFLIDWALEEKADWIIFEDADDIPNYCLQADGRKILDTADTPFVLVTDLFLWKDNKYFPDLSCPYVKGQYEQGLWAWKADADLYAFGKMPHFQFERRDKITTKSDKGIDFEKVKTTRVLPPYCRLHHNWETEEITQDKLDYYTKSGLIPGMNHPLIGGGTLAPRPVWAR